VTLTPKQILALVKAAALLLLILALVGFGAQCARKSAKTAGLKQEVKAQERAAKQVERSVKISTETAERVVREGEQTRQRTQRAVENVDAIIEAAPVPDFGADDDILRESREAYQRSIAAHCGVFREGTCPEAATAP